MVNKKQMKTLADNREIFQELKEIKSDIKEVKKFLIINILLRLVENYDKQAKIKQEKWERDIELVNKDQARNKEIAEWDRIQDEDDEKLNNGWN